MTRSVNNLKFRKIRFEELETYLSDQLIIDSKVITVQWNFEWFNSFLSAYNIQENDTDLIGFVDIDSLIGLSLLQKTCKPMTRFWKERILVPLGYGPSDFFAVPVKDDYELRVSKMLVHYYIQNSQAWERIIVDNLQYNQKFYSFLIDEFKRLGYQVEVSTDRFSYYVDTTGDWDSFYLNFISKNNKDLLKDLRKIDRSGINLTVHQIRESVWPSLKEVLEIYAQRRKSLGQKNTYNDSSRELFVKSVIQAYEKSGNVELSLLKDQNDQVWAFQLDWIWEGVRYHWNHAFNEDFKTFSPGKILLLKLLEISFADPKIVEVNHMRGNATYKSKLADKTRPYLFIQIVNPFSWRKRVVVFFNKFRRVFNV